METENTTTAAENMTVAEPETAYEQVNVDDLVQTLTQDPPAQEVEEEQTPSEEDARLSAYRDGIQSLYEDEWTAEELTAFSHDAGVHEDLKNGKTVRQAARAYLRRQAEAVKEKPSAKKSVPTVRAASGAANKQKNFIEEMTTAQFREFSRKAQEAMLSGKNVSFD